MNKGSPLKRGKARIHGGVAQLGEHLPCKQGVKSSIVPKCCIAAIVIPQL